MKEILNKLDIILTSAPNPLFQSLRNLLIHRRYLTIKQKAAINLEYQKIARTSKNIIVCDIEGNIEKGCWGLMKWGYRIKKGKKIIAEDDNEAPANNSNTYNVANYMALSDCLLKLRDLGLNNENITLLSPCYALVKEMNNLWRISKHNMNLRQGLRDFIHSSFPHLRILCTEKQRSKMIFKYSFFEIKAAA